jgi:hypothetical protein
LPQQLLQLLFAAFARQRTLINPVEVFNLCHL